jgi:hypothetical protein
MLPRRPQALRRLNSQLRCHWLRLRRGNLMSAGTHAVLNSTSRSNCLWIGAPISIVHAFNPRSWRGLGSHYQENKVDNKRIHDSEILPETELFYTAEPYPMLAPLTIVSKLFIPHEHFNSRGFGHFATIVAMSPASPLPSNFYPHTALLAYHTMSKLLPISTYILGHKRYLKECYLSGQTYNIPRVDGSIIR